MHAAQWLSGTNIGGQAGRKKVVKADKVSDSLLRRRAQKTGWRVWQPDCDVTERPSSGVMYGTVSAERAAARNYCRRPVKISETQ